MPGNSLTSAINSSPDQIIETQSIATSTDVTILEDDSDDCIAFNSQGRLVGGVVNFTIANATASRSAILTVTPTGRSVTTKH
jgi:hypothetical protein